MNDALHFREQGSERTSAPVLLDRDPLPYTLLVKGRFWYFRHRRFGTHRLPGEYRDEVFMARYLELMSEYSIRAVRRDLADVYFVGWEGGPVKIGYALDPRARLTTMQAGCPYKLNILALAKGGRVQEKVYHRRFAPYWIRGEWFARNPDLEAEMSALNKKPLPSSFKMAA